MDTKLYMVDALRPIVAMVILLGPFVDIGFLALSFLFLSKWLTGISSCVFGLLECKARGVPRDEGYINRVIDGVYTWGARDPILPMVTAAVAVMAVLSESQ